MCASTGPHNAPSSIPSAKSGGSSAAPSGVKNHANPSSVMSAPKWDSGRRRHAYRPVPTKLQPTSGPKSAHAPRSATRSPVTTTTLTARPAASAAAAKTKVRR